MLDYLGSKMVWIVAAIVLTASVIGVFNWQRSSMEELELDERADGMQEMVNGLFGVDGEFTGTMSFQKDQNATYSFPSTINDEAYVLNLTPSGFFISQESKRLWRPFIGEIKLFDPVFVGENTSTSTLEDITDRFRHLRLNSGDRVRFRARDVNSRLSLFFYRDAEGSCEYNRYFDETRRVGGFIEEMGELDGFIFNNTIEKKLNTSMVFTDRYLYPAMEDDGACRTPFTYSEIQLWRAEDRNYTFEEIDRLNEEVGEVSIQSGQNVTIQDRVVDILVENGREEENEDESGGDQDGYKVLMTFLYGSD